MAFAGIRYSFKVKHLEAWFWIAAIIVLASINPAVDGHASLCVAKKMNLWFCPGCGLGHSIAWFFRGEFGKSFQSHPFGIPAILILLIRSYNLLKAGFSFKTNNLTR